MPSYPNTPTLLLSPAARKPCYPTRLLLIMRLLDTSMGQFVEFPSHREIGSYAILSHTWSSNGEQSYQDLLQLLGPTKNHSGLSTTHLTRETHLWPSNNLPALYANPGISEKIRRACMIARSHGYRYVWIDSCCIDKTSSAELSEAINSMYAWYRDATICYAFLADVPSTDQPDASHSLFRRSRWFTRGWTLQELIAPRSVHFLSSEWENLRSNEPLPNIISQITGIDSDILTHRRPLSQFSVAQRMSWAANRECTRIEDEAYSLMGIFDITMPTLYGEGHRAFLRLQREILGDIPDQSLLAWGSICTEHLHIPIWKWETRHWSDWPLPLFARSPRDFREAHNIRRVPHSVFAQRTGIHVVEPPIYTASPYGVRATLAVVRAQDSGLEGFSSRNGWYLVLLACELEGGDSLLAIACREKHRSTRFNQEKGTDHLFLEGAFWYDTKYLKPSLEGIIPSFRIFKLWHSTLWHVRQHIHLKTVYFPQSSPSHADLFPLLPTQQILNAKATPPVALANRTEADLRVRGYTTVHHAPSRRLVLWKGNVLITVDWHYTWEPTPIPITVVMRAYEPPPIFTPENTYSWLVWISESPGDVLPYGLGRAAYTYANTLGHDCLATRWQIPHDTMSVEVTVHQGTASPWILGIDVVKVPPDDEYDWSVIMQ